MRRHLIGVLAVGVVIVAIIFASLSTTSEASPDQLSTTIKLVTTTTTPPDPGPTRIEVDRWQRTVWVNETNRRTLLTAVWVDRTNQRLWIERQNRIDAERRAAAARAAERATRDQAPASSASSDRSVPAEQGTGRCGGDLPPCYVMMRESGGNIRAENPTSTASGKWQFLDSTWAGFGGYSHAAFAPESVQDAKARQLWAGGAGCSHWSAC